MSAVHADLVVFVRRLLVLSLLTSTTGSVRDPGCEESHGVSSQIPRPGTGVRHRLECLPAKRFERLREVIDRREMGAIAQHRGEDHDFDRYVAKTRRASRANLRYSRDSSSLLHFVSSQ